MLTITPRVAPITESRDHKVITLYSQGCIAHIHVTMTTPPYLNHAHYLPTKPALTQCASLPRPEGSWPLLQAFRATRMFSKHFTFFTPLHFLPSKCDLFLSRSTGTCLMSHASYCTSKRNGCYFSLPPSRNLRSAEAKNRLCRRL